MAFCRSSLDFGGEGGRAKILSLCLIFDVVICSRLNIIESAFEHRREQIVAVQYISRASLEGTSMAIFRPIIQHQQHD